jgi:hypothetical protein
MSDYDNFDDLDAVRDFRSGVGLLEPEVDDRIRRRIIELAVARGLVEDSPERRAPMEDAGRSGVRELPADRGQPPTSTSAGSRSSDGSATVVELHAAARPPARQPRMLVAAAAIVVVILVAGAVLVSRRGPDDKVDIANPPNSSSSTSGVIALPLIDSIDTLKGVLTAQPQQTLGAGQYVRTSDSVSYSTFLIPSPSGPDQRGSLSYTLVQERGVTRFDFTPSDSVFRPVDGGAPSTTIPPTLLKPTRPFGNLAYDELVQLGQAQNRDQVRSTMLGTEGEDTENYDVVANELQLLRLPIVPPAVRALLVDALTEYAFVPGEGTGRDGSTFRLVLRNAAGETVTVRFDASSGAVLGWEHAGSDGAVIDRLDVVEQPQVVR